LAFFAALLPASGRITTAQEAKAAATVRFINASTGAPAVDLLLNGQPVAQNIAFGATTEFASVAPDDYTVQIVPTGENGDSALASDDVTLDSGKAYIFAAKNPLADIDLSKYDINLDSIDAGKARVRAINLAQNVDSVDIAIAGGDQLFGGVDEGDSTDYKDVDYGTYDLDVRQKDNTIFNAKAVNFNDGRVYDVFFIGDQADQSLALLPLETNVSAPCSEVLGLSGADSQSACVRVVHGVTGVDAVDVYIAGSPMAQGLSFGTATDFVAVQTGDDSKLQITSPGGTVDDSLADKTFSFDAGQAYQVVVSGDSDNIDLNNMEVDLTPLPDGQARIRAVHAAKGEDSADILLAEGADPTFNDVGYGDSTDYKIVDADDYSLQVMLGGDNTVALASDAKFETGMVYDLILVGKTEDSSLALLVLSAPAEIRTGGVSTPESGGTPVSVGTQSSAATPGSIEIGTGVAGATTTPTP